MSEDLRFHKQILDSVLGGVSAIDLPKLHIEDLEEAYKFVRTYGYNLNNSTDVERVWSFYVRAIAFIQNQLLQDGETIPPLIAERSELREIANLLLFASGRERPEYQRWACGVLRVMHVLAHIDNDLFIEFSEPIQEQVLKHVREHMRTLEDGRVFLGRPEDRDQIELQKFEIKPFKATSSAVIKLLSKPQSVALNLLDKMGVRFVTENVFDAFRVVRFLVEEHIVSFPNIMPDQGRNNLYPVNLFLEVIQETREGASHEEIEARLNRKIDEAQDRAEFLEKRNEFSSAEYRSIKFIARQLIELQSKGRTLRFFFPYEVQIVDQQTYLKNLSGPTAHAEYKKRQLQAARTRVFGAGPLLPP